MEQKRSLKDLMGKNIVVYDLEIKRTIDKINVGWRDFDKMGISVGVLFDYRTWSFGIYLDDNIHELNQRLNEPGTLIVAFNQKGFDNNICRKDQILVDRNSILKPDPELLQYDMLEESRNGSGGGNFAKGHKLDDHLQAMGLPMKNGDGADAPGLYQRGEMGKLITYGVRDVACEKSLFDAIYLNKGFMRNAYNPKGFFAKDPASIIQ